MVACVIAGRESRAQRLHHYAKSGRHEMLSRSGLKSLGAAERDSALSAPERQQSARFAPATPLARSRGSPR
jgi:hypothetical protein